MINISSGSKNFMYYLTTDRLKDLKNNAIQGGNRECIIFVKSQYPEVFNSFKDF